MDHTVTAVSPSPITLPIDCATGPETMSINSAIAASTTATTVSSSITGRSFQNGRPSWIS